MQIFLIFFILDPRENKTYIIIRNERNQHAICKIKNNFQKFEKTKTTKNIHTHTYKTKCKKKMRRNWIY